MKYVMVLMSCVLLGSNLPAGEIPPSVYTRTPLIQSRKNPDPPVTKYVQVKPVVQSTPYPFQVGAVYSSGPVTTAPNAATVRGKPTSSGVTVRNGEPTYTLAPSMGLGGITSEGCSGGNCAAPSMQRRGFFGR